MENQQSQIIPFKIMDQEFTVTCPKNRIYELKNAVHYLEKKMQELNTSNKTIKMDHLAIITALNITRELITVKQKKGQKLSYLTETIQKLKNKIEQILALPA